MMKLRPRLARFPIAFFLTAVLFAPSIGSQVPQYVNIQVTNDANAPKGKLSSQWEAMKVRNTFGVDFVLRQRIPQVPKRLLVYLDGGGSVGHDNYRQLRYPDMIRLLESDEFSDTLVLLPQCSNEDTWDSFLWDRKDGPYAGEQPSRQGEALNSLVAQMQAKYSISKDRTLIWGISLGAFGLLDCVTWHPELYGTIVSLAGGGDPARLTQTLTHVTVWLFHGMEDSNVPPSHSQRIADELQKRGIPYRLRLLAGANHGIMEIVLKDPEFVEFLISWTKK